ncbi:MAG: penicillin-binding protein 1C [Methylocystaceae bacterium]|nr:penicillin-binding protein 1C [Methylocystaceae bacterium]
MVKIGRNKWFAGCAFVTCLITVVLILNHLFPPNLERLQNVSIVVEGKDNRVLRVFSTPEGLLRLESKTQEIDPRYFEFLKSYEDKRYDSHWGVDPFALIRATWQWIASGSIISGGSTLTMQVARLLEPRARTITSKLIEIARSLQLEWYFTKQEILDMYVTLAPFGGRLEGVNSASLTYFQKKPEHLTIAEAALLTVIPQSPSRLRPDRFPSRAKTARKKVLKRLLQLGVISPAQYKEALAEPIPSLQHAMPMLAPHLSERLIQAHPLKKKITTPIDPLLQAQIQQLVQPYTKNMGVTVSAAVVVVENQGRWVRAHVGSNNYIDHHSHGFVDMSQAVRSPGSTLKPLIYALSFNDRQIHPQTLIWDQGLSGRAYRPSNFDREEHGQVTIADALRFSLNIPAVKVLSLFGPIRFSETLREHGITLRLPHESASPNLAIALGGVGVTLEELTSIYSAFASDRKMCPLMFERNDVPSLCENEKKIISVQTQDWIRGILENTPRPRGNSLPSVSQGDTIAFKTGTSYGFRDAWAIGFNAQYTVGVWIGDATGRPVVGQTGLSAAAPLLFSVFEKLPGDVTQNYYAKHQAWKEAAPDVLQIFKGDQQVNKVYGSTNTLEIKYPLNGTTLLLSDLSTKGVLLQAINGQRPLTWMVNGVPLVSNKWKRDVKWYPAGPGFYKITVLDKNAVVNSREIEIRE